MGCTCSTNDDNNNIVPQKRKSEDNINRKKLKNNIKSSPKKPKSPVKEKKDEIENGYNEDKEESITNEKQFKKKKIEKTEHPKTSKATTKTKNLNRKNDPDIDDNLNVSNEENFIPKKPKKTVSNLKRNEVNENHRDKQKDNQIKKNKMYQDDDNSNLKEKMDNIECDDRKEKEEVKEFGDCAIITQKKSLKKESQNISRNEEIINKDHKDDIINNNFQKEQSRQQNLSKKNDELLMEQENEGILNDDEKIKNSLREKQEIKEATPKNIIKANMIEENQGSQVKKNEAINDSYGEEEKEEGTGNYDPLLIICPYLGSIISPTQTPDFSLTEPDISYELCYIYGYRCEDSRMNLYFTYNNKIVYSSSSIGIVLDLKTNEQNFFGGKTYHSINKNNEREDHDRDIISLTMSSDKSFVATGQTGANSTSKIFIWEVDTCKLKTPKSKFIFNENSKGISAVGISPNNKYIACADLSEKHYYYLFEIDTGREIFKKDAGPDKICDIKWNEDEEFFCVGVRNAFLVNLNQKIRPGDFKDFPQTNFACLVYVPQIKKFYAGGSNGKIYIWENSDLVKAFDAHNQIIQVINLVNNNIISGSNDHSLKLFNFEGDLIKELKLSTIPKSIDFNGIELIFGGLNGSIYTCTKDFDNIKEIVSSHSSGELWGLDIFEDKVITSGEDNQIKVYSYISRKLLISSEISNSDNQNSKKSLANQANASKFPEDQCSRLIKINPYSRELIIGTMDGKIQVRNLDNLQLKYNIKTSFDKGILCAEFSPDGKLLAVGSENSNVYLFDIKGGYLEQTIFKGLGSVRSLEWNEEGSFIRTNTTRKSIFYYNIKTSSVENKGHILTRDQNWTTFSNTLRWGVEGIFRRKDNPDFVNCICKHPKFDVIFSGNNAGFIEIYRYPCKENAERIILTGHSEKVVKIMADQSGHFLFSIGGKDKTLMQWKLSG